MAIYESIYDGPARNSSTTTASKRYIAIHNTSNDASARNEASYAKRRTDSVSSHYYVDDKEIIQSLDTRRKAWHAGSQVGNTYAISYEIVGTNGKSRDWWLKNVAWDLLAKQIAKDMARWGIQNKKLSISEMQKGGISGIVTHDDMRRAWGGTTHTDPGSNFPMDHLIKKVNEYIGTGGAGGGMEEDMTGEERQWLKDLHWALFSKDELGRDPRSISAKIEEIRTGVAELKAKDMVDEDAVIQGVLAGISPEEIAKAIPTNIAQEVVDLLVAKLSN